MKLYSLLISLSLLFPAPWLNAENKTVPEEAKKTPTVDWALIKEYKFTTLEKTSKYLPYFVIKNRRVSSSNWTAHFRTDKDGKAKMSNYEVGGHVEFYPKKELLLSSSRVYDATMRLV